VTRAPDVVERHVGRDPASPCSEAPFVVELGASPIDPPEGFYAQVLGYARVPDDLNDSPVHLALKLLKERFERFKVIPHESPQQLLHDRLLLPLLNKFDHRFIFL
jgi:hypothetical protein